MSWTTPADLRAQVQRLWNRGDLLRAAVSNALSWPVRLTLKGPSAADLSDRFEAVRDWVRAVADTPHVRIDWREWNHRVQGTQRLPDVVWVDTLQEALAFIGKARQAQGFGALWQQTASAQPALLAWMTRRPLQTLELADRWERLLAVVAWLQAHPRPGLYLRQVDAPGVDSKFIEAHRGELTELLDLALPPGRSTTISDSIACNPGCGWNRSGSALAGLATNSRAFPRNRAHRWSADPAIRMSRIATAGNRPGSRIWLQGCSRGPVRVTPSRK